MNMILDVGFGPGNLRRTHHRSVVEGQPYVIAGRDLGDMGVPGIVSQVFEYHRIKEELTFHWFKHNIMCKDHPRICERGDSSTEKEKGNATEIPETSEGNDQDGFENAKLLLLD